MGWFSSEVPAGPKPSVDGAFEAPDRTRRAHCWEARDSYFRCLDKAGILDGIQEADKAAKACGKESDGLETNCATSWVSLAVHEML